MEILELLPVLEKVGCIGVLLYAVHLNRRAIELMASLVQREKD